MRLSGSGSEHLCYCSNIHPGESLDELCRALTGPVAEVKARVCPDAPFGIGLRLAQPAAQELMQPCALDALSDLLDQQGLYVFTINGFPYGRFHGARVKEAVYQPDWTSSDRSHYTHNLFHVLSALLPRGVTGSVSTVPGCFRPSATAAARRTIAETLAAQAAHAWSVGEKTGKRVVLALEPEPHCMLETSADVVSFYQDELLADEPLGIVASLTGLSRVQCEQTMREHIGVCVDACHVAVEFEDPASCVARLRGAGIAIAKLQISCGLRVPRADVLSLGRLQTFDDAVYLHQTRVRDGAELRRYLDLPEALSREQPSEAEWRVHYHVPIFLEELDGLLSTQPSLLEFLRLQQLSPFTTHLEVETYTWDVLPKQYRSAPAHEAIARELNWVLQQRNLLL